MNRITKAADEKAKTIRFGVELETFIPVAAGIMVGGYHAGREVYSARALDGNQVSAPIFNGAAWRAERDSSIRPEPGYIACEFVCIRHRNHVLRRGHSA